MGSWCVLLQGKQGHFVVICSFVRVIRLDPSYPFPAQNSRFTKCVSNACLDVCYYNDGEFLVCLKLSWIWSVWFSSKHFTVLEAITSHLTVGWISLCHPHEMKNKGQVDGCGWVLYYCLLCLCGNLPRCHSSSLEYGVFFQLHVNAKFHISRKFIWIFEK